MIAFLSPSLPSPGACRLPVGPRPGPRSPSDLALIRLLFWRRGTTLAGPPALRARGARRAARGVSSAAYREQLMAVGGACWRQAALCKWVSVFCPARAAPPSPALSLIQWMGPPRPARLEPVYLYICRAGHDRDIDPHAIPKQIHTGTDGLVCSRPRTCARRLAALPRLPTTPPHKVEPPAIWERSTPAGVIESPDYACLPICVCCGGSRATTAVRRGMRAMGDCKQKGGGGAFPGRTCCLASAARQL